MQSLRSRRSQAPGKSQRSPSKLTKAGAGPPTRKATTSRATGSRVDDKIKKRLSMRYADISGPTELNVPAVPSIPREYAASQPTARLAAPREQDEGLVAEEVSTREDPKIQDKRMLDESNFDADAFLKLKLANSTEAELKSLQSSLRVIQNETATELQQNVFKNYEEFVVVSKEISSLENEMLELKESLSEWKSMPSLLHIDDNASLVDRKRAARSSIADLRVLYANQMQTLHAQIEGSTKFAPTISGRHVVAEIDGISSLNAATYKVEQTVKMVILDDLILVARKKRRPAGTTGASTDGKWVAERCWPLNEMLVLDTKDSSSMTNVFKVKHGKETHVYRTETSSEKKSLLSQFRAVADELAAKKRKEREGEHERRRTMWNRTTYMDPNPNVSSQEWMIDLARRAGMEESSSAKDKSERDARWANEWADELTVAIALREWDKAVSLIEQGKLKLAITPPLAPKIGPLTTSLTTALLGSLSQPSVRKTSAMSLIAYLDRLGAGVAARTTFLEMREKVIKSHIRKIKFTGDITSYIGDLAIVCFTGIKHTADWFLSSFKENPVASSFVEWAKTQIEMYAEMFRKQVYSSGVSSEVASECLKITYSRSQKHLQEFGLDFRFLLDNLLVNKQYESKSPPLPPSARPRRTQEFIEPTLTPSPTPARQHSPEPPRSPRTATPPVPPLPTHNAPPLPAPVPLSPGRKPMLSNTPSPQETGSSVTSSRARTPVTYTNSPSPLSVPPTPSRRARTPNNAPPPPSSMPQLQKADTPPLRTSTKSPGPPPRSTNRPGSTASRAPPVAVPQHDGMF